MLNKAQHQTGTVPSVKILTSISSDLTHIAASWRWNHAPEDQKRYVEYVYGMQQKYYWLMNSLTLNPPSLQNKTTEVEIQQHSRKLLMIDILMSETC